MTLFWDLKVKGQGHTANKYIYTLMTITSMLMHIWLINQHGVSSNSMSAF